MSRIFSKEGKVLVIGDIMLDIYHIGKTSRISPEAPVPVVQIHSVENRLGGAANVANNISSLGSTLHLLGYAGNDSNYAVMKNILEESNISSNIIMTNNPTITKIRVVSGVQQIVRVDFEKGLKISEECESALIAAIRESIFDFEIIVLSDYGKGLVSESFCKELLALVRSSGKILIVDPKGNNWNKYSGATVVTPNLKELADIYGSDLQNVDEEVEKAGRYIIDKFKLKYLIVTRSEKGMSFLGDGQTYHISSEASEVYDVSGAGDTVVATLATALASSYSWKNALELANKAAGIVVSKFGTAPITLQELENSVFEFRESDKILHAYDEKLIYQVQQFKIQNKRIVFTNGVFDIIHKGHIKYLQQAKSKGDILVVGLNSDESAKRLKGPSRPIKDQDERALILSALEMVDYVIIFDDDTPVSVIKLIEPDVLVKGGDYKLEEIVGREFAKETISLPFVDGYSTTSIISKMSNLS